MSSFQSLKARRSKRELVSHRVDRSSGGAQQLTRTVMQDAIPADTQAGPLSMVSGALPPRSDETRAADTECAAVDSIFGFYEAGVRAEKCKGRGRGLFATRAFAPGQTVYKLPRRPPSAVLSTKTLSTHCSACCLSPKDAATLRNHSITPLKRCSGCRVVHYCSPACAKDDWTYHKPECSTFRILRERFRATHPSEPPDTLGFVPGEAVRALGRLFWDQKRCRQQGDESVFWKEYQHLQSAFTTETAGLEELRRKVYGLAFYISVADGADLSSMGDEALEVLMQAHGVEGNPEVELMRIWSRFQINGFTLDSPDLTPLGVIIAPALAMANHSCDPNAVVVFPKGGGIGQITAIRHIQPGEEVLVCYIDVASPYSFRQEELKGRYHFTCDCNRCAASGSGATPREIGWSVRHPDCDREGWADMPLRWEKIRPVDPSRQVPTRSVAISSRKVTCEICERAFEVDVSGLELPLGVAKRLIEADETGQLEMMMANEDPEEPSPTIALAGATSADLVSRLPPSSHPLIPLHQLIARLLLQRPPTTPDELGPPLYYTDLALQGALAVYTPHHPVLATIRAQKAGLMGMAFPPTPEEEMKDGESVEDMRSDVRRMQAALVAHREAIQACAKCFGSDGGLVGIGLGSSAETLEADLAALKLGMGSSQSSRSQRRIAS